MSEADALLGLAGHRAVVVGGGQGMGRATALHFARAGCDVAVVDLERERAESVAGEIASLGRRSAAIAADARIEADASAIIEHSVRALGGLDHVVNIVGMASWASLLDVDRDTWQRDHALNLEQHLFVSRSAVRHWVARGEPGTIAVVASVSGLFGAPSHGAYGAAKAGLMSLVKTMAEEWYAHDVRVNAVAPGSVRTPRILAQQARGDAPSETGDAQRWCEMDDVAGALLFLSSQLARGVTGQTLVVDRGKTSLFPFPM